MAASVTQFEESSLRAAAGAGLSRSPAARIGKYEVEREIGCGGLIKAFRGFDREIGRPVALKVLTAANDLSIVTRFRREVADMARLRTPRVVSVYELGEHVGFPFVAMQAPTDNHLRQLLLCESPLTLLQKMLILWQVGEGLEAAHQAGLAFVRLRPSGVALDRDGQAALHDFGIVRLTPAEEDNESRYASPEELAGEAADIISDIFTLGVIYRDLLSADLPPFLAPVVDRASQRRRDLRYQSFDEFRDDVEPLLIELKTTRAQELLSGARDSVKSGALEDAQTAVREVLHLQPDNREAQRLRTELRNQVRRATLRPRVESLLREAEDESGARRFTRAAEVLKGIPALEGSEADLENRLKELRLRVEHGLHAAELAGEAGALLEQVKLDEARVKAQEACEWDPESPEIAALLKTIDDAIARHVRETRIEEGLAKAKSLLLLQSFQSAIQTLVVLSEEYPDEPVVERALEQVRRQQAEMLRQGRLQRQLKEARALLAEERYNAAILLLGDLTQEFPEENQVAKLLEDASTAKNRTLAVAEASAECARWRAEGNYDKALEILEAALSTYPDDSHLASLRTDVRQQSEQARLAAAVAKILEQASWLVSQDRPDLAVQMLREKSAAHPGRPDLAARLTEVEEMLPAWESRRIVRQSLDRVAAIENVGQWSVALTIVEEALDASPDSDDLKNAAERLRGRLRGQERSRKLARRLEMIGQKMTAESWPQALLLIEAAEREFPGEPALERLHQEAQEHARRAQFDQIAVEVRQHLADGEIEEAEEMVRQAETTQGEAPLFASLHQEADAARKYLEDWRTAQIFFGRRQFDEAEKILLKLAAENRPDALVLLEKVREARAAIEEDSFYNRGREKALKLIQDEQWEAAAELLRNLLALFPADAILERDLGTVEPHLAVATPGPAKDPAPEPVASSEAAPVPIRFKRLFDDSPTELDLASLTPEPSHRLAGILPLPAGPLPLIGAALVLLVAGGAGVLALLHRSTPPAPAAQVVPASPISTPAVPPAAEPHAEITPPAPAPATAVPSAAVPTQAAPAKAQSAEEPAKGRDSRDSRNRQEARRVFDPSTLASSNTPQTTTVLLPAADMRPAPNPEVALPGRLLGAPSAPAPATAPRTETPAASKQDAVAVRPSGGHFVPAARITGINPTLPAFARQLAIRKGTVTLILSIDSRGIVRSVTPVDGHPVLATVAKDAVKTWKYRPATLNGKPTDSNVEVHIVFDDK